MRPADQPAFVTLLTEVLAFYGQTVSGFSVGVWWQACQGFELGQVRKALTAHAIDPERGAFAPKPADLVRQLQGTQTDRSLVAWGKVLETMQRVGAYTTVVFDDPSIHAAIEDMGGWPKVCREPMDALPHVQRRFCEAHRVHARQPGAAYPAKLAGAHEAENRLQGRPVAAPILIGDPERAQLVMQGGTTQNGRIQVTRLDLSAAGALLSRSKATATSAPAIGTSTPAARTSARSNGNDAASALP